MRAVKVATLVLVLLAPSSAHAQAVDLTRPDPVAVQLSEVRLDIHRERREAGFVLLLGGLASVVGGGVVAGVGNADPFWLGFGLGTAAWGLVNAALSIGSLDIGDGGFARIRAEQALRGEELADLRESELRRYHDAAAVFALNLGLDVFYIASGVLLFFLADQLEDIEPDYLRGYSVGQIGQGAFLMAFDIVEWIASADRASRIAEVPRPR